MPVPWLRSEPFFFGVGAVADQILLGIVLPPFRGDEPTIPAPLRFGAVSTEPAYRSFGLDDTPYLRPRVADHR